MSLLRGSGPTDSRVLPGAKNRAGGNRAKERQPRRSQHVNLPGEGIKTLGSLSGDRAGRH